MHQHDAKIDIEQTKAVGDFFDACGSSSNHFRLNKRWIGSLKKTNKSLKDCKERFIASIKDKKSKLTMDKKKRNYTQNVLEDLSAKLAAAQAERDVAKAGLGSLLGVRVLPHPRRLAGSCVRICCRLLGIV